MKIKRYEVLLSKISLDDNNELNLIEYPVAVQINYNYQFNIINCNDLYNGQKYNIENDNIIVDITNYFNGTNNDLHIKKLCNELLINSYIYYIKHSNIDNAKEMDVKDISTFQEKQKKLMR